jgi:hypothetical protein
MYRQLSVRSDPNIKFNSIKGFHAVLKAREGIFWGLLPLLAPLHIYTR